VKTKNPVLKVVEFNDKSIYYLSVQGVNHILIRPLCEALGVDADRQIRDLKDDEMLAGEVSEQTTRLPTEDRNRPYVCLPEEYVYGFVFGIRFSNTMSEETKANLTAYKRECYDALYQHFHKRLLLASETLQEKAKVEIELRQIRKELIAEDPRFARYDELLTIRQQLSYRISQGQKTQLNLFLEQYIDE